MDLSNLDLLKFIAGGIAVLLITIPIAKLFSPGPAQGMYPYTYPAYQPYSDPGRVLGSILSLLILLVMAFGAYKGYSWYKDKVDIYYAEQEQQAQELEEERNYAQLRKYYDADEDREPERRPPKDLALEENTEAVRPIIRPNDRTLFVDHPAQAELGRAEPAQGDYYVQQGASATEEDAIREVQRLSAGYPDQVWLAYDSEAANYPYKILIGPFASATDAKQQVKGKTWVRNLAEEPNLQLYLRTDLADTR